MLVLNTIAGFGVGVSLIFFRMRTTINGLPAVPWIGWVYNIALQVVGLLQIYSGVILVKSVLSIRRFFIDRKAEEHINTRQFLRHSACFVIYIVTSTSFTVAFGIYTLKPTI